MFFYLNFIELYFEIKKLSWKINFDPSGIKD